MAYTYGVNRVDGRKYYGRQLQVGFQLNTYGMDLQVGQYVFAED